MKFIYQKKSMLRSFFSFKLTTKQITYGALFGAASAVIILILLTYTPVASLPTVRIAFEGILIKLSGYLFGPLIGFLSGNITELLILILRPTFVHWAYYLVIVLYGIFGGFVRYISNNLKQPGYIYVLILLTATVVFSIVAVLLINAQNGIDLNFLKLSRDDSYITFFVSEFVVYAILPVFYVLTNVLFTRFNYLFKEIIPIYFLSVLTGFFISIPIQPNGDAASYGVNLGTVYLFAIVQTPINIIVNMIIIYLVWKILYRVIVKQQLGKYNVLDVSLSSYKKTISIIEKLNHTAVKKRQRTFNYKLSLYEKIKHKKILKKLKIISVTGTNGKTTVAQTLGNAFKSENISAGVFTSPHVFSYTERISINNFVIDEDIFTSYANRILPLNWLLRLTTFEFLLLLSLEYFADNNVDYAILECGIGAKKDCVGQLPNFASLITSIGLDHIDLLGPTLEDVVKDKSYIIKPHSLCFINETDPVIIKVLQDRAEQVQAKLVNISSLYKMDNRKVNFKGTKDIFKLNNIDKVFQRNYILAAIFMHNFFEMSYKFFFTKVKIPFLIGRNQVLKSHGNTFYVDGAHNLAAIKHYVKSKQQEGVNFDYVFCSFLKNKDFQESIKYLRNNFSEVFVLENSNHKTIKQKDLVFDTELKITKSSELIAIIKKINTNKKTKNSNILVIGSFYYASDFIRNYYF